MVLEVYASNGVKIWIHLVFTTNEVSVCQVAKVAIVKLKRENSRIDFGIVNIVFDDYPLWTQHFNSTLGMGFSVRHKRTLKHFYKTLRKKVNAIFSLTQLVHKKQTQQNMELTPDEAWDYIHKAFYRNDVTLMDYKKLAYLMDKHFDFLRQRGHIGTPLLHEAGHQSIYLGSNFILLAAWRSEKWRSLFNSPAYLSKRGEPVWKAIRPQPEHVRHNSIPDTNYVRQQIKIAFSDEVSAEETWEYLDGAFFRSDFTALDYEKITQLLDEHFVYLERRAHLGEHPLLHEAGEQYTCLNANLILMATWNSEKWRPLFDSADYLDPRGNRAWQRVKPQPPDIVHKDFPEANEIRFKIMNTFLPEDAQIKRPTPIPKGAYPYSTFTFVKSSKEAYEYLYKCTRSKEPGDYFKIAYLMDEHFEYLREQRTGGHPLLHEAAEQNRYLGANFVLLAAWKSEKWKPLFNSEDYLCKYGDRAWRRIRLQGPRDVHVSDPETNHIRQEIKDFFKPSSDEE